MSLLSPYIVVVPHRTCADRFSDTSNVTIFKFPLGFTFDSYKTCSFYCTFRLHGIAMSYFMLQKQETSKAVHRIAIMTDGLLYPSPPNNIVFRQYHRAALQYTVTDHYSGKALTFNPLGEDSKRLYMRPTSLWSGSEGTRLSVGDGRGGFHWHRALCIQRVYLEVATASLIDASVEDSRCCYTRLFSQPAIKQLHNNDTVRWPVLRKNI